MVERLPIKTLPLNKIAIQQMQILDQVEKRKFIK